MQHTVGTIIYTRMSLNFIRCLKQCSYSAIEVYGSNCKQLISCCKTLQNGRGSFYLYGFLTAWPPPCCLQLYLFNYLMLHGKIYVSKIIFEYFTSKSGLSFFLEKCYNFSMTHPALRDISNFSPKKKYFFDFYWII